MAGSMLLSLLRSEGQASLDAVGERFVMAPPSGDDTLQVRQTYLRKRRSRPGTWHRTAVWVGFGATACWLCIAVFVFGS